MHGRALDLSTAGYSSRFSLTSDAVPAFPYARAVIRRSFSSLAASLAWDQGTNAVGSRGRVRAARVDRFEHEALLLVVGPEHRYYLLLPLQHSRIESTDAARGGICSQ